MIKPVDGQIPPDRTPEGPERDALVELVRINALDFLSEAQSMDPAKHGRSIAHSCYYAVYWLSRAVLTKKEGTYPWRHSSTEKKFSEEVSMADPSPELLEAFDYYTDAARERTACDYDLRYRPPQERAQEILDQTERFFEIITNEFDLKPEGPP